MMRTIEQIQEGQLPVLESDASVGDYVFATKYKDADPMDRWAVDFIKNINTDLKSAHFEKYGVIPFRYVQKITDEEGRMILNAWEQRYK